MGKQHDLLIKVEPSHAAVGVGKLLFRLFALALELPETYFDNKVGRSYRG